MPETLINIKSADELYGIAERLLSKHAKKRLFAFVGEMGVGKTTFIKEICKALNVTDEVISPTFAIVNEYKRDSGDSVYHFDFYRINKLEEAFDIGYEEYFYSSSYCFIEWPEIISSLLPENHVVVRMLENPDRSRSISF